MKRYLYALTLFITTFCKAQGGSIGIAAFDLTANGGNGNGVIEDAELQRAFTSSYTRIDLQSGATYTTNRALKFSGNKTIVGNGATIKAGTSFPTGYILLLSSQITQTKSITSLSVSVSAGSTTLNYSGNLNVGDLIKVLGPVYATFNGADYSNGWFARIVSKTTSTLTLSEPAPATFTANAIKCYKPVSNVTVQDIHFDSRGRTGGMGPGAEYATNIRYLRCTSESNPNGGLVQGFRMVCCLNSSFSNCLAYNGNLAGTSDGPGYGISGHYDTVQFCRTINFPSGASSADRDVFSTHLLYYGNEIAHHGNWTGLDFHANATGEVSNNKIWMFNASNYKLHTIHVRRGGTYVHDNICYYPSGGVNLLGVYMFEEGYYNVNATDNTFYYATVAPTAVYNNLSSLVAPVTNLTSVNNQVIQLSSIPAQPPAEIMGGGVVPPVDTSVVIIPTPLPPDTTNCYFIHLARK